MQPTMEKVTLPVAAIRACWTDSYSLGAVACDGIEHLRKTLRRALGDSGPTASAEAVYLTERQRSAIAEAIEALDRAVALSREARQTIDCADLLAFELRETLDALGAVTGDVTTEDLLRKVFANFCIGK